MSLFIYIITHKRLIENVLSKNGTLQSRFFDFGLLLLFPFDSSRGFRGKVEQDSVYAFDFLDYAVGYFI